MNYAIGFVVYMTLPVVFAASIAPTQPVAVQAEMPQEVQPAEEEPPIHEPEAPAQSQDNRDIVRIYTIAAWGEHEWSAMQALVMKESGFRNTAQNPRSTAYGMFQFLDATWSRYGYEKTSDPITQTEAGIAYIKARYGTPSKALDFHLRNNWY